MRHMTHSYYYFFYQLKMGLLYLTNQTRRGKVLDIFEDLFCYVKERYFVGEVVLGVIGNLW